MEFHIRMYGVSKRMYYVRVMYVRRMKRTHDVYTAYVLCSLLIYGVSVACTWCFNTDEFKTVRFTSS